MDQSTRLDSNPYSFPILFPLPLISIDSTMGLSNEKESVCAVAVSEPHGIEYSWRHINTMQSFLDNMIRFHKLGLDYSIG